MRLLVTTPVAVVVDSEDARAVRAEDETGAFGILPGHADFITVLTISVITWRDMAGAEHHVVVRGGILTVRDGAVVEVVTREAVGEDTLPRLDAAVLARMEAEAEADTVSRSAATRLHLAVMRQLEAYLAAGRATVAPGRRPPRLGAPSRDGGAEEG